MLPKAYQDGKIIELRELHGSCDTCGHDLYIRDIPAIFVARHETDYGIVDTFELCFWHLCPGCRANVDSVKLLYSPITAESIGLKITPAS